MKKTVILISVFSVYAAILIVAGIFALNGVNNLLDEYEASQPQYLIESVIKEITEAAEAGEDELSEIVDFDSAGFTSSLEVYGDQIGHFADLIVKILCQTLSSIPSRSSVTHLLPISSLIVVT